MHSFDQDRCDFFNMLEGKKTIQLFKDNESCKEYPRFFHFDGYDMPLSWIIKLEDLNVAGLGIYMCVNETNGQGRKKEHVIRVRAAVADLDGAPLEPVWQYNPTMVIETSPGKYHAYFRADDIPLEGFTQLQKAIAYNLNSDSKVCDLPRVFRIPGFHHHKGERFLSRIIHHSPQSQHTFRSLQDMFPPAPVKQWSAPRYQKEDNYPTDGEFKGQYGACDGSRNVHLASRIGGMLKRNLPWGVIEQEAFKEAMSCSPPLSESETRAIIKSMRRYA